MISEESTEEEIRQLEEIVPITMLTKEQLAEASKLVGLDAVKYINRETNCGLKFAKTYFDLYIDKRR